MEDFFEFERENRKLFDDFYRSKGWACKRIYGKENKKYDCELLIDGNKVKVEEKFRSKVWPDCLVETIQDTKTNSPGWIYYTKADYILYGMGNEIYSLDAQKLRNFVENHKDAFNKKISRKGWGITENIAIPWYILFHNGIARKLR